MHTMTSVGEKILTQNILQISPLYLRKMFWHPAQFIPICRFGVNLWTNGAPKNVFLWHLFRLLHISKEILRKPVAGLPNKCSSMALRLVDCTCCALSRLSGSLMTMPPGWQITSLQYIDIA